MTDQPTAHDVVVWVVLFVVGVFAVIGVFALMFGWDGIAEIVTGRPPAVVRTVTDPAVPPNPAIPPLGPGADCWRVAVGTAGTYRNGGAVPRLVWLCRTPATPHP